MHRGKPLPTPVSAGDPERLETGADSDRRALGALALLGAWGELEDSEMDALVEDIYSARRRDLGRAVEPGD